MVARFVATGAERRFGRVRVYAVLSAHYFADPGAWPHCGRDARLAVPPKKQARPNR